MKAWEMSRTIGTGLVIIGLTTPSPIVWAQVDAAVMERDPILASTIEAATRADPDLQKDSELRVTVEQLTKDCLTNPQARAEIAHEVGQVRAEGGVEKVIAKDVLTAVRGEASTTFASREADLRKALEALPAGSTERKMAELSMEHGKQVMEAYAKGEASPPPPREMIAHAQEMFKEWAEKSGASQREVEMAKFAMERFASGEKMGPMGPGGMTGPGHEMGPPSDAQLKAMVDTGKISTEQYNQMQKDKSAWDAAASDPAAREALMQKYAADGGMHQGFEGSMMSHMPEGLAFDQSGNVHYVGTEPGSGPRTGFEGSAPSHMPEGFAFDQSGNFHYVATEATGQIQQQSRDIQQQIQEHQLQFQQSQQQGRQEITMVREVFASREQQAHVAEHDGNPFNGPETRLHDHYTHIMSDGTTVDHIHDVPVGTPVPQP